MKPLHRPSCALLAAAAVVGMPLLAAAAPPADWSAIPAKTIMLFYPGQSTYDWLVTPDHKKGDKQVLQGKSCVSCHDGDEADIGKNTVSGKNLEPTPIPGKKGTLDLTVQAAHDAEALYLRFQWKSQMNREGRMHDYMRFDGKEWTFWGGHRAKEVVREGKQPPLYEDRLAIMLDDGKVPLYAQQGCWLTCHNGMRDTPKEAKKDEVEAHAYLGKSGLKKNDIRKYLPASRTDGKSWAAVKSKDEVAKLKKDGQFLDLWQWRAARSNAVGMADDGYVLDYRLFDAGKNPFAWNVDRKTMTPKFMFDAAKVGFKALREGDIGNPAKPAAIVREANAVPYDPNAGWKEGDILPGRVLSRADAKGSAADNDDVKGTWKDGIYTVIWRRKLNTGHPEDDKILKVGGVYTVGFAVHDDNVTTRFHHVSFPFSLGIGTKADIQAVTVK
jgi:hypothetical protein